MTNQKNVLPSRRSLWIGIAAILLFLAAAYFFVKRDVTEAGNETSRLAVVQSLVDNGTFDIRESIFQTPDKAVYRGGLYGDKPPLLTWLTAGWYFVLAKGFGLTFKDHFPTVMFLIDLLYFLTAAGTGILFYLAYTHVAGGFTSVRTRAAVSALAVLSTLVFSYSVSINNHTPCALLLMLLLLQLQKTEAENWPLRRAFFCGVTAGLIFNCEFVLGGVYGLCVLVLCLTAPGDGRVRFRRAAAYAAGGLLLLALEAGMNIVTYGSPLPLYLLSHKPDMVNKDYLFYAWNILFGFEGFFLYMPACLFLFFALLRKFPGKDRVCACMLSGALGTAVLFAVVTSDYGGFCYGFRFLIPLAPVLLFYVFLSFQVRRKKGLCGSLFALALFWGVVTSLFGTMDPWNCGYEGSRTKPGTFLEKVRNGFLSNVLVFTFDHAPRSGFSRFLIDRVYGKDVAFQFLYFENLNRHNAEGVERVARTYETWDPGPAAEQDPPSGK